MTFPTRSRVIAALAIGSVLACVTAASGALNGSSDDRSAENVAALKSGAASGDRHALARSFGIDPTAAKPVFRDSRGKTVLLGRSAVGACLVQWYGDTCRTAAQIAAGDGTTVTADCSTVGAARDLTISGLVPPTISAVHVGFSDGSQRTAKTVDGAYLIEGATPEPGEPYPTTIDWTDGAGKTARSAPFPYDGQHLCVPAPSQG